jgi:hypothetical protein
LLNGAGDVDARPTQPGERPGGKAKRSSKPKPEAAARQKPASRPKPPTPSRSEMMAKAQAADEAVLTLIRDKPGVRTGEIVKVTQANGSTMAERLRRLKERGLIGGGGSEGWTATA